MGVMSVFSEREEQVHFTMKITIAILRYIMIVILIFNIYLVILILNIYLLYLSLMNHNESLTSRQPRMICAESKATNNYTSTDTFVQTRIYTLHVQ